jgi:16S rRNA processing protein RimM
MQSVPEPSPSDAVVVGRVVGAYGVQGWLRIEPFNAPEDSVLLHARRWHLQAAEGGRPSSTRPQLPLPAVLTVERCRVQGAVLVANVAEIKVREVAESPRGQPRRFSGG